MVKKETDVVENKKEVVETTTQKDVTKEKVEVKEKAKKVTMCMLSSKANYIIPIKIGNKRSFIQPFGKIKVIKEQVSFNREDAKYLTFIKM